MILLNGENGNFCLDLSGIELDSQTRSEAWSSNVSHYLSVHDDYALVQSWHESRRPERVRLKDIEADPESFHSSLVHNSPTASAGIVAHAVHVFRQLRTAAGANVNGQDALGAFLVLLAVATEGSEASVPDGEEWVLSTAALEVADAIPEQDWATLIDTLTKARPVDLLRPEMELVLRHSAGSLFQDAHYLATFPLGPQLMLGGMPKPECRLPRFSAHR